MEITNRFMKYPGTFRHALLLLARKLQQCELAGIWININNVYIFSHGSTAVGGSGPPV
jgi:hypothetical protein